MDWRERRPEGVGPVEDTEDGFQAPVQMLVDEDGYFGRQCSACDQFFKFNEEEYLAPPEDFEATCPYCGRQGDANSFITEEQLERAKAAAQAVALQMIFQEASQSMERAFRPSDSAFVRYTPGTPPPISAASLEPSTSDTSPPQGTDSTTGSSSATGRVRDCAVTSTGRSSAAG
jgi:hypothetical protein